MLLNRCHQQLGNFVMAPKFGKLQCSFPILQRAVILRPWQDDTLYSRVPTLDTYARVPTPFTLPVGPEGY